jgi:hypothetical protein
MEQNEIIQLADLLVRWHNQVTPENSSFYGASMDKALCRDTFSTLYRQGDYMRLQEINKRFVIPAK